MSEASFNKKIRSNLTAVFLLLISIALIFIFTTYISDLKKTLNTEAENFLVENSTHITQLVNISFDTIEKDANTIKRQIENSYDVEEIDSYLPFLKEIAEDRGYLRICIADTYGNYHASDGYGTHLSDKKIYDQIMSGESHFINSEFDEESNQVSIIYGLPLIKDGVVKAAMFISNDDLHFSDSIDDSYSDYDFSSVIIDKTGNYVFRSTKDQTNAESHNFFDLDVAKPQDEKLIEVMKNDMQHQNSGFIEFTTTFDNIEKIVNYQPIGKENWYLLSMIPSSTVKGSMNVFITYSVMIVFLILCLFLLVMFFVLHNQKKSRKELEKIAYVDFVTNGSNDNRFAMDALQYIQAKPESYYCMVSMDVKNFKIVNSAYGSRMGNRLLEHIYKVFHSHLHDDEVIARMHGDVFHILMRYISEEDTIQRLKEMVDDLNSFNDLAKEKYYLYFQSGIYIIDIPDSSMIMIQDRANVARKKAKEIDAADLSTCYFYRELERQQLLRDKDIENRMEEALANHEFLIYLHPKYNLQKQKITGAEALIRWMDPVKGFLLPKDFLSVFEKNSFILKIDLYAFEKVCELLERWYAHQKPMIQISVNISKLHLHNPNFLEDYIHIFHKYHFPASYIRFEVTESLVCDNLELLKSVMSRIHELGFTISLDDFGSGYSSLNLLKDIDVDELKLDKEFFMSETIDKRSACIIESIIALAKKLKMDTVCEGVQTEEQIKFLKDIHCDMIQAFIAYEPMSVDELENLIHQE